VLDLDPTLETVMIRHGTLVDMARATGRYANRDVQLLAPSPTTYTPSSTITRPRVSAAHISAAASSAAAAECCTLHAPAVGAYDPAHGVVQSSAPAFTFGRAPQRGSTPADLLAEGGVLWLDLDKEVGRACLVRTGVAIDFSRQLGRMPTLVTHVETISLMDAEYDARYNLVRRRVPAVDFSAARGRSVELELPAMADGDILLLEPDRSAVQLRARVADFSSSQTDAGRGPVQAQRLPEGRLLELHPRHELEHHSHATLVDMRPWPCEVERRRRERRRRPRPRPERVAADGVLCDIEGALARLHGHQTAPS